MSSPINNSNNCFNHSQGIMPTQIQAATTFNMEEAQVLASTFSSFFDARAVQEPPAAAIQGRVRSLQESPEQPSAKKQRRLLEDDAVVEKMGFARDSNPNEFPDDIFSLLDEAFLNNDTLFSLNSESTAYSSEAAQAAAAEASPPIEQSQRQRMQEPPLREEGSRQCEDYIFSRIQRIRQVQKLYQHQIQQHLQQIIQIETPQLGNPQFLQQHQQLQKLQQSQQLQQEREKIEQQLQQEREKIEQQPQLLQQLVQQVRKNPKIQLAIKNTQFKEDKQLHQLQQLKEVQQLQQLKELVQIHILQILLQFQQP